MKSSVTAVIGHAETMLAEFYDFEITASATQHTVTRHELESLLGRSITNPADLEARASTWVDRKGEDLFIGIHFDDNVLAGLEQHSPLEGLTNHNLDSFCVVVEEVSHFHLLVNRLDGKRNISKLELELQGEVDKLLICALLLRDQCGDPHWLPLARQIFDESAILDQYNRERYWQATKHAARLWYELITLMAFEPKMSILRQRLQNFYLASLAGKLDYIHDLTLAKAS